jgi:hypothetical protein
MGIEAERRKYPGLLPREGAILRAWLQTHEPEFNAYNFNVKLGPGSDPGPRFSDEQRAEAIANSKLRADVIAWQGPQATIIEVKENAGTSALGQILTYGVTWAMEHPTDPPPLLRLVTDRLQANVAAPLQAHGVTVDVVSPDYSGLPAGGSA